MKTYKIIPQPYSMILAMILAITGSILSLIPFESYGAETDKFFSLIIFLLLSIVFLVLSLILGKVKEIDEKEETKKEAE